MTRKNENILDVLIQLPLWVIRALRYNNDICSSYALNMGALNS